jgi:2-polyprenyl-6-methoxyphenol hydroxylase-like FAD-dependent oxidoreductase
VTVVEEAGRLRTPGAAVSLWFNGATVLRRLAVPIETMGAPIGRLLQGGTDGRIMFDLDASRLAARFGVTSVTVPGRRLLTALADGLPPAPLRFGAAARRARHRVPARYARPGVVLIGDAVHARPPSLAQGVSQTLEDARVLARELERRPGPADAPPAYQRARRRKVLAVSRQASSSLPQRADGWFLRPAALPSPVLTSVFGTYLRSVSNIL